eukprot:CAMPEP_0201523446 /NCGR_PEP_ID=MMETSP0161_2-20130828/19899_1 /ASSEMBLY_ACC=CAM_ASM_000251 /TAXON_ID=180227 /ORGANISM="Neoparamoeba aestuarina, Strain SoJaBio B1-5/56/2" /LENGTH=184 /DNA_ID=CAMNT_0047922561 /DNA_START=27 /DNA_END=581 /DNA_ORIENTATION=-
MSVFSVLCIDHAIGRVDKSSFSQTTLLELLTASIVFPQPINEITGYPELTFNDAEEITSIRWGNMRLTGSVPLEWLPPSSIEVSLYRNDLSGTVSLTALPQSLRELILSVNRFSGTLDLTCLPYGMEGLYLDDNFFEGEANFSMLPISLLYLWVNTNPDLSGRIQIEKGRNFDVTRTKIEKIYI